MSQYTAAFAARITRSQSQVNPHPAAVENGGRVTLAAKRRRIVEMGDLWRSRKGYVHYRRPCAGGEAYLWSSRE
jgi:hypothetical protein